MAVSKVVFGNETLIDITDSTVTAADLRDGKTAYDKSGAKITGNANYSIILSGNATASKVSGDNYQIVFS